MKRYFLIATALLLAACQQPMDQQEAPANTPPTVELVASGSNVEGGNSITFTAEITDPDSVGHECAWTVDGSTQQEDSQQLTYTAPELEAETAVLIEVEVSDSFNTAKDSYSITVLPPPWQPEELHVYVLESNQEWSESAIVYDIECTSNNYYDKLSAARLLVDSHNQDYPDDPWEAVGGGLQE